MEILKKLLSHEENTTFELWADEINKSIVDGEFGTMYYAGYHEVQSKAITLNGKTGWSPIFSPQVTIQHPLGHAIPLYFSLFGFDSRYMLSFKQSLPFRDPFLETQKKADSERMLECIQGFKQKLNGLVFLHALTISQMCPLEDDADKDLILETHDNLRKYSQVDAKMRLTLMSRRPFSEMYREIPTLQKYAEFFNEAMRRNIGFYFIHDLFSRTNYAEQHVNVEGAPKDLSHLLPCFSYDFVESNRPLISELLQQGVVSTTMLRNLKAEYTIGPLSIEDFFKSYMKLCIATVDTPQKRVRLNVEDCSLNLVDSEYDILSPPCFLEVDNSMGAFKEGMTEEDKSYGEAIVEVRGIRDVHGWFLKKCGLSEDRKGHFLTDAGHLMEEVVSLFDYLKQFGKGVYDFEIFYLGMPYALRNDI